MRFKVAKRDLDAALSVVDSSISSGGADLSAHFLFRRVPGEKDGEYGIEVMTYSGRIFSSCPVIGSVEDAGDAGAFTIEGARLKAWLSCVSDGQPLEFTLDDKDVVARATRGKQTFQSLDPDSFPYWDKMLKKAKVTATIDSERMAAALGYSKLFASDKERSKPELCVCEVKAGILFSTDKKAVCLVEAEGLVNSSMRVHYKDANGFIAFLSTCDSTQVEVLEHDRMIVMRRGDGAIFGQSRFQAAFPGINVGMDKDNQHTWVLPKEEMVNTISWLKSGAAKEDNRLHFMPGKEDGEIIMSMLSVTGKKTELPIEAVVSSVDKAPEVPSEGFALDHFCLAKVLSSWKGDTIKLGINVMGDRGFVRFVVEEGNDTFLTIIAWLR